MTAKSTLSSCEYVSQDSLRGNLTVMCSKCGASVENRFMYVCRELRREGCLVRAVVCLRCVTEARERDGEDSAEAADGLSGGVAKRRGK